MASADVASKWVILFFVDSLFAVAPIACGFFCFKVLVL